LSGDNLVICRRDTVDSTIPCMSETGRKFLLKREENTRTWKKVEKPSDYYSRKLDEDNITCIHKPEKCAVNDVYKAIILDSFTSSLINASNVLDALKGVIGQEKERMKQSEESAKERQAKARESLKSWGKL